ncbi:ROK family protein [Saccharopolyspora cebuensis]|uniref:ROK family protein n=1 Tax=Saccharopolyspora cebuensis TaxID=418759 RepID=A0ABV4CH22_9PSEU
MTAIGVDIGGTKIAAGLVVDGAIVRRTRRATPRLGSAAIFDAVAGAVAELRADGPPVTALGIGAPGIVDPVTGTVRSATDTVPGWHGAEVRAELARRTGLPVAVDNDVRAMALAECRLGAARGHDLVLHVSVGTGVGGAFSRGGVPVRGERATAGEIAHLLVPTRGAKPCGCGRDDHLEAVASGPAIAAAYTALAGGEPVELPEVERRMRAGDDRARQAVTAAGALLGRVLSGLVTALDLDAVVVGGGAARLGAALLDPVARALDAETRPPQRRTPVLPALLQRDGPVLGAALLTTAIEGEHR